MQFLKLTIKSAAVVDAQVYMHNASRWHGAEQYTCASDVKAPEQDYLSQGSPALAQETVQHDARQRPEPAQQYHISEQPFTGPEPEAERPLSYKIVNL